MKKYNNNLILLTSLAFGINELITNGYREKIEDIHREIQNGSIVNWLQDKYGQGIELDIFRHDDSELQSINKLIYEASIRPSGKYVLINEGLPLIKILCMQALAEYV